MPWPRHLLTLLGLEVTQWSVRPYGNFCIRIHKFYLYINIFSIEFLSTYPTLPVDCTVIYIYYGLWSQTPSLYSALQAQPWQCMVSVGLSGYCPGQQPSMHPPLSCHGGQLILAPNTHMPRHHMGSDISTPDTCPSPETIITDTNSPVCVRVGITAGRYPQW